MINAITKAAQQARKSLSEFLALEAASGIVLFAAAAVALIVANTGLVDGYEAFRAIALGGDIAGLTLRKPLELWVNDGLMALFFLIVALEIKREIVVGQLSSRSALLMPLVAAAAGMAVPALIYTWVNAGSPDTLRGWAIPAATDIAFALGVMALLGSRVPVGLKILLTAIAILDDLGAIVVIAIFYTDHLAFGALGLAFGVLAVLIALNRFGVTRLWPYLLLGIVLWVCVLKSGVHATLAGVALGLCIPLAGPGERRPAQTLEHALHPWVAYAILPLFAFVNAGLTLHDLSVADMMQPVPLGIILGLFVGKQIGIFGAILLLVKTGMTPLPPGCRTVHIYGLALLSGIGFTMSLFIGGLAFPDPDVMNHVRLGVLVGSGLSALAGLLVLYFAGRRMRPTDLP